MKKLTAVFATTVFLGLLSTAKASLVAPSKIYCTHPAVCNLAKSVLPSDLKSTQFILAYKPKGDIHESTPTSSEMKNLAGSEYLLVGPSELHFWSKKLLALRQKKMGSTIVLEIKKNLFPKYQKYSNHALAHFWLYPDLTLELQKDLASELANRFGLQSSEEPASVKFYRDIKQNLRTKLATLRDSLVILTHDALLPLLQDSGAQVFSLKSNEHGEVSPLMLKKLEENFNKTSPEKTVWILEQNISVTAQIKKMIKQNHKKINLNTEGSSDSDLEAPLKELFQQLGALK